MVKNLPSVERSTKIRFGKHVPDSNDQEENTVVFNASNDTVPTPYSNAVYLSPIRNRPNFTEPQVVLLMYDKATKEITESGESANALVGGVNLGLAVQRSNVASNVVRFLSGEYYDTSFVTDSNVGLSNFFPQHTVSVGSNLYVDDVGSNVLVVSGNVAVLKDMIVEGNLTVNGDTTVIYTENTSIKDAFIELGRDNTSGDTTLDLGVLMHRPDALSNVVIGYREGNDEFAIAYTDAQPTDKTFTPKTDEDINVHVYGLTHVDANIYAHEDVLVDGNIYVSQNVSVTEELTVSGNVYADKDLEVIGNTYVDGNVVAYKDLTLSGNAYVSGNVNVTKQLSVSGNAYVSGNVEVTESLIVSANTHLKGDNVFITHTMDFLDPTTAIVTDQISNVQIRLGQLENVANTVSNPLINQVLTYDQDNSEWSNAYPDQTIVLVKNTSGVPMTRGQAVHVTGSNGNNMFRVELADASDASKMPAIGIVYEDIPINGEGAAVTFGRANGISGISEFTNGDTLYVSNTVPGGLTNVKPYGVDLDLIQNIGVVVNHSSGVVFVTGIGRANDIPNARIITDYNDMQYVYVNSENNDLKKIASPNLNIPLTTAVSSSSNSAANAVTLRGVSITSGDGFHGDLVVAGNVTVDTNTLKVDAEANRVGILTASPGQTLDVRGAANVGTFTTTTGTVTDGTHSTSKDSGVLVLTQGGLGVEANIHSTNVFATSHIAVGTSATSNTFDVRGTANVGALVATSTHISDSTAVTSKTTGALQVTGGVGIQGDIHATHANLEDVEADSVTVTDATAATNKTTGALKVTGGVGVQGDLYASDTALDSVKPLNMSTHTIPITDLSKKLVNSLITQDNGAVIINANVEIAGNISVIGNTFTVTSNDLIVTDRIITIANNNPVHDLDIGIIMEHPDYNIGLIHHGSAHVGGAPGHHLSIGYINEAYDADSITWQSDEHITANIWGHLITQNTVTVEYNDVYIVGGGLGIGIGDRGDGTPDANIHVVGNVFVTSNITTSSNVLITGDAAATSKTTGALQVAGGAGIQGDIYSTNVTGSGTLKGATLTGTNLYGTLSGSNTAAVSDLTATGTVKGATLTGTNLYGTLSGSNTAAVSDLTATGTVKGATLTGTNMYGTLSGSNTAAVSDLTATGTVKGSTLTGTNLYGTLSGSNAATVTTLTASDVVDITDTTVADSTTTGALTVAGGISTQANLYVGKDTYITSNLNVDGSTLHVDSITSSVGIGKTDPRFTLDVAGDINFTGTFRENGTPFVSTPWTIESDPTALSYTSGNIGVGAANPPAKLTVTGNTWITSNLTVDTNTLHVDSEANRVGIGKTDPAYTLDVNGTVNAVNLLVNGSALSASPWTIESSPTALSYTSGNVGIGLVSPAYTLDVGGTANVGILTTTSVSGSGASLTSLNASNLGSGTVPSARLSLASSDIPSLDTAKITTGTFDAARIPNLDTAKITTGTFDAARIPSLDAAKITTGTFNAARIPNLDAAKITTGTFDAARIPNLDAGKITTGTFDAARIPNLDAGKITTGTLGRPISTTDGTFTGTVSFGSSVRQMLNLYGTSYALGIQSSTLYYRSGGGYAWFKGGTHSNTTNDPGTGGALAMKLDASYNLTATGDVTAYSDKRVKTDISKIDNALEKVCSINGYTYKRIDTEDEKRHTGVLAQEVVKVLPEVVHGSEETTYSVAYGNMAGLFIEAMKDMKSQLDAALRRIDELEKRL